MRRTVMTAILIASAGGLAEAQNEAAGLENSVVKVFSSMRYPDPYKPWTKQAPTEATGSGVVISGNRILTNAHVVMYASEVQIRANQSGNKLTARVETLARDMDLAILKLEDSAFFADHPPLGCGSTLPEIKDAVMAFGYPVGGDSLSVTKGIVSRIDFAPYGYDPGGTGTAGLRIQVDAAINPGNSGGPAVVGDKMIGLAFSSLGGAQNISYIIPCAEIEPYLADVADGRYDGKPVLTDRLQTLENAALRTFLRLPKETQGIVVDEPKDDPAGAGLRKWDVITKIGTSNVDDQGMVRLGSNSRVGFQYLVQSTAKGGKVPLTVVRDSKTVQLDLAVKAAEPGLIPSLDGEYPSYFVYGPLVFSNASMEYVSGFLRNNGMGNMLGVMTSSLVKRMLDKPAFPGESLVVVAAPFFPHRLSQGYSNPMGLVLRKLNGTPVTSLVHLVEMLRDQTAEFVTLEFEGVFTETLVFSHKEVLSATEAILTDNGVRSQGSADTLAIWNAKPAP
ncbi:MAG: trypsin-like peptidase domain-containing protein [Vicinamibacteria bacterium]|nr:trypsin-like peptidase domain-containing protein [Vicinamibacteria bacterium]